MTFGRGPTSHSARGHRQSAFGAAAALIAMAGLGIAETPAPASALAHPTAVAGGARPAERLAVLGIYDNAEGDVRADWTARDRGAGDIAVFDICAGWTCVRGAERGLTWTPMADGRLVVEPDQLPEIGLTYSRMSVWISVRTADGSRRISAVQTIRFAPAPPTTSR